MKKYEKIMKKYEENKKNNMKKYEKIMKKYEENKKNMKEILRK